MGRKKKHGLREGILTAAKSPVSASMIQKSLSEQRESQTSLVGIIKAAEELKFAGLLQAQRTIPELSYRGGHTQTYYHVTPQGKRSLKDAIAKATEELNKETKDTNTKQKKDRK